MKKTILLAILSGCQMLTPKQDLGIAEDAAKVAVEDVAKGSSELKIAEDVGVTIVEDVVKDEVALKSAPTGTTGPKGATAK
jgi:lysophospholipid acyltransferase (LPLAT)-like uncharacterized protein